MEDHGAGRDEQLIPEASEVGPTEHDQHIDRLALGVNRLAADTNRRRRFAAADLRPIRFRLDYLQPFAGTNPGNDVARRHRAIASSPDKRKRQIVHNASPRLRLRGWTKG